MSDSARIQGAVSRAKISAKGWVVIPAPLRRRYGLEPGQSVQIVDYGGVLSLVPPLVGDPVQAARGAISGGSLRRALLDERRRERARDR